MKIYKYLLLYLLSLLLLSNCQAFKSNINFHNSRQNDRAEEQILTNLTYKESIKSVQLHKDNWPLSYPVLDFRDQVPLTLSFDELGADPGTYSYTITHCDYQWQPTDILKSDYIDGLQAEIIQDFEYSVNTHQDYIHYQVQIPNDDMQLKLPGNYVITVFQDYDQENLVLTRRFFVVDEKVTVNGTASRSNNLELFYTHHEVDFTILHPNLRLDDPSYNIRVVVMQNLDWQTAKYDLVPAFTGAGELIYDYEEENQFPALSEFRHFETKNLNYITDGIEDIRFERPLNHVYLLPDHPRSVGGYVFDQDINGKFVITYHLDFDPNTGADYLMTHFKMPFDTPITGGSLYVFGALSDWSFHPNFEMTYHNENNRYELDVLLKQGYYNYQYRFVPDDGKSDPTFLEGSFFETENDYLVFVYYQDFSNRYQQLIGFTELNNINKNDQ